jgi:Tol biopolymer transport system component
MKSKKVLFICLIFIVITVSGCQSPTEVSSLLETPAFQLTTAATLAIANTPPSPTSPAIAATPEVRPSGSVVFVSRRTDFNGDGGIDEADGTDLYVVDAASGEELRITSDVYTDQHPRWSPDGTQIAFSSNRDGDFEVFVINADGSGLRQVTRNQADEQHPDWSSDGSLLCFISDRGGLREVYIANLTTGEITQQTHSDRDLRFTDVDWSPTNERLVLVATAERGQPDAVWLLNLENGTMTSLTPEGWAYYGPRWSPDGGRILVQGFPFQSDGPDLLVLGELHHSSGTYTLQLASQFSILGGGHISWSPNGEALIGSEWLSDFSSDLYVYPLEELRGGTDIVLPSVRLTNNSFLDEQGDWRCDLHSCSQTEGRIRD